MIISTLYNIQKFHHPSGKWINVYTDFVNLDFTREIARKHAMRDGESRYRIVAATHEVIEERLGVAENKSGEAESRSSDRP